MKKLIVSISFLLLLVTSFAQQTNQDHLKKSKSQKTAAIILISGGGALCIAALVIGLSNFEAKSPAVLGVVGLASMLGSAPLFRAAARNKRIAMSGAVGLKIEKRPSVQQFGMALHSYPAIAVRINLR